MDSKFSNHLMNTICSCNGTSQSASKTKRNLLKIWCRAARMSLESRGLGASALSQDNRLRKLRKKAMLLYLLKWFMKSSTRNFHFVEYQSNSKKLYATFFEEGIYAHVTRWNKCINLNGNYIEKLKLSW